MVIETRCQTCGRILAIADQHAGQIARCPKCKTDYTVPQQSDLASLDAVCHFCDAALEPGDEAGDRFRTCVDCDESIAENQRELQREKESALRTRNALVTTVLVVAAFLVFLLIAELVQEYSSWFR